MKAAYLLFGLAATTPAAAEPHQPLCDTAGAPACGNLGQVGRLQTPSPWELPDQHELRATTEIVASALTTAATRAILPTIRLLFLAQTELMMPPIKKPHRGRDGQYACGNIMSKCSRRSDDHADPMLARNRR